MKIDNNELDKKIANIIYELYKINNKDLYYDIDSNSITTQYTSYDYNLKRTVLNKKIKDLKEFEECIDSVLKKENWEYKDIFKYIIYAINTSDIIKSAKEKLTENEYNEFIKIKNYKKIQTSSINEAEYVDLLFKSTLTDKEKINEILNSGTRDISINFIEKLNKYIEETNLNQVQKNDFFYKFIKKRKNASNDMYKETMVCSFILNYYKDNNIYIEKFKEIIDNLYKFIDAKEIKKEMMSIEELYSLKINFNLENLYTTYMVDDNSVFKINLRLRKILETIKDLYGYKDLSISELNSYINTSLEKQKENYRAIIVNDKPINKELINKLIINTYEKIYKTDNISDKNLTSVISEIAIQLELSQDNIKNNIKTINKI